MRGYVWVWLCLACPGGTALAAEPVVINAHADFPEGPFFKDGKLYYTQYGGHKVNVWDGVADQVLWTGAGCGPSAVLPWGEDFLVTCYDNGSFVAFGADGKTKKVWDRDAAGAPIVGPNDATPDGKGGAYLTASGPWESGPIVGAVYHLSPEGVLKQVANDLHYANGIQLSADGKLLYVNESEAGRVITFAVAPDGALADRRVFVRLSTLGEPAEVYPDGIKLGPDGNLYVGLYSAGRILVVAPDGKLVRKVEVPAAAAPNLAFSADGKTVYVAAVDDKDNAPYKGKVYSLANEETP